MEARLAFDASETHSPASGNPIMKTSAIFRRLASLKAKLIPPSTLPSARSAPAFTRPEPLEERFVLSSFLVTNLANGGPGSLRNAITKANATPAPDTIAFQPGLAGTIVLTTGDLNITAPIAITGPGAATLKISGHDTSRIFDIDVGKTVSISGLTLTHGLAPDFENGGGIRNRGIITLTGVTIDSCAVSRTGAHGGAIDNDGTTSRLTLISSKILNNHSDEGGGIFNGLGAIASIVKTTVSNNSGGNDSSGAGIRNDGTMSIRLSTISGNIGTGAFFFGGGIRNDGNLTVLSSTISGNLTQGQGGGIRSAGTLILIDTTVTGNIALGGFDGTGGILINGGTATIANSTITKNFDAAGTATSAGGLALTAGTLTLHNSVIADNFAIGATPPDIRAAVAVAAGNFIGIGTPDLTGITTGIDFNRIGTLATPLDPKLGPLQNNGGPTLTRLPLPGSPLINAGVNSSIPTALLTDQRGLPRIHGGRVDIGATEY